MVVRPIRLAGEGEVVRVETTGPGVWFAVTVACKQLAAHVEDYISGAAI
jgi:hypothetical protein